MGSGSAQGLGHLGQHVAVDPTLVQVVPREEGALVEALEDELHQSGALGVAAGAGVSLDDGLEAGDGTQLLQVRCVRCCVAQLEPIARAEPAQDLLVGAPSWSEPSS